MQLEGARGFDWDEANAEKIRAKHGVDPFECEEAFFNPIFVSIDKTHSREEAMFQALGVTHAGRELFLVFTMRGDRIRVISARDMSRKERARYDEKIKEDA